MLNERGVITRPEIVGETASTPCKKSGKPSTSIICKSASNEDTVNTELRNRLSGKIGSATLRSTTKNSANKMTPDVSKPNTCGDVQPVPCALPRLNPSNRLMLAAAERIAPRKSTCRSAAQPFKLLERTETLVGRKISSAINAIRPNGKLI